MAERPRELDQRFQMGGSILRLLWIEELLFAPLRHDAIYAYASYSKQTISSTRPSCWIQISTPSTAIREQHCGRPSDVYNTDQPTKLTALETISRWLILKKRKKSLFEPPFRALRGNIRTPSMARWKARRRLYIRRNWTFFAISYGWDVMSGNRSKSAFFEGGGSLWTQISEGRGRRRPTTLGIRVAEWLLFRVV